MDIQTNSWIFQNDATAVGDGKVFKTGRNDQLTVYITGSATFEVLFEGCDGETIPNWFPVPARKFPEMTVVTSTTVTGAYSIDLANFAGIRCRISAIANGALRVTGRAVNVGSGSLTNIPNTINTIPVDSDGDEKFTSTNPAIVKATDLETLVTTLNGKVDTLDTVIDTIKDTIIDKVTVETTGISDVFTLLNFLNAPGYGDEIDVSKYGMVRVHITKNNSFNGTLTFQGLVSGSAYKNILVRNVNTGILVETIPSPNPPLVISEDYIVDVRGLNKIRIQATYTTAGDVSATGRGEPWTEIQYVNIANDQPISMSLSGSKPEQASAQDTQVATTAKTYTKAAGATQMEVYCETGYIRVRTDGEACTSTTGEPIAAGFGSGWQVDSISVYYIQESVITVVSR
jgi:hypothetical protein